MVGRALTSTAVGVFCLGCVLIAGVFAEFQKGLPCDNCGLLREIPVCGVTDPAETVCKIHIDMIRPTQFSIGPLEVIAETVRIIKLSSFCKNSF
jgi:hypothetical protein